MGHGDGPARGGRRPAAPLTPPPEASLVEQDVDTEEVVEAAGDVSTAVRGWMIATGRLAPDAALTHLEVRGWTPT